MPGIKLIRRSYALLLTTTVCILYSCEKSLVYRKTCAYGQLEYAPDLADSVLNGATYQLTDANGNTTCLLEFWNCSVNQNMYLHQSVTAYGETRTGILSTSTMHLSVDSLKK